MALRAGGFAACCLLAGAVAASAAPTELWRANTTHLQADRTLIGACLQSAGTDERRRACIDVVRNACAKSANDDVPARTCDWRGIAAWEDEMAGTIASLNAILNRTDRAALTASQRAWKKSMLDDVALVANRYTGGTMAGTLAAATRADETAERAIFLARYLQQLQQ